MNVYIFCMYVPRNIQLSQYHLLKKTIFLPLNFLGVIKSTDTICESLALSPHIHLVVCPLKAITTMCLNHLVSPSGPVGGGIQAELGALTWTE